MNVGIVGSASTHTHIVCCYIWQVSSTNGHIPNYSSSETGSVSSNSDWKVSAGSKEALTNGKHDQKASSESAHNGFLLATKKKKKKAKKLTDPHTEEPAAEAQKRKLNSSDSTMTTASDVISSSKKHKSEVSNEIQESNETTPEPTLTAQPDSHKKKRKRRKKKKKNMQTTGVDNTENGGSCNAVKEVDSGSSVETIHSSNIKEVESSVQQSSPLQISNKKKNKSKQIVNGSTAVDSTDESVGKCNGITSQYVNGESNGHDTINGCADDSNPTASAEPNADSEKSSAKKKKSLLRHAESDEDIRNGDLMNGDMKCKKQKKKRPRSERKYLCYTEICCVLNW